MAHINLGHAGCNDATMLNGAATELLPIPGEYCRKLSDVQINSLAANATVLNAYRVTCGGDTRYFRSECTFDSTAPVGSGPCSGGASSPGATDYFGYAHDEYFGLVAGAYGSSPGKMFYWANNHNSCLGPDDSTYFNGTNTGTLLIRGDESTTCNVPCASD
jgi:hypothetical protein